MKIVISSLSLLFAGAVAGGALGVGLAKLTHTPPQDLPETVWISSLAGLMLFALVVIPRALITYFREAEPRLESPKRGALLALGLGTLAGAISGWVEKTVAVNAIAGLIMALPPALLWVTLSLWLERSTAELGESERARVAHNAKAVLLIWAFNTTWVVGVISCLCMTLVAAVFDPKNNYWQTGMTVGGLGGGLIGLLFGGIIGLIRFRSRANDRSQIEALGLTPQS